ncbi:MAG: xanthine dehydrogenase family protein molybdopterin-binding subunit [Xanthobacteraceae bacterium]
MSTDGNGYVGRRLRRKEDPPLITGKGVYTDDMTLTGMLYAAFVRSPEAHARITSIDASAAQARDGIHAVLTAEDLDLAAPMPMAWVPPGVEIKTPEHWPLARGEVKHVGQAVAVVIGEDKYAVVDATEDVVVEYDPLPVVVDPEAALAEDSPLVHEQFGTNRTHQWGLGSEDMDAAWAEADVVIERRIVNHRTHGAPIEPRACIAEYRAGYLTLWTTTQIPHLTRSFLAGSMQMSEDHIRVVAPDVGGGFGVKLNHYPEEAVACAAARRLGRPVKWTETRSEHMTTSTHGRDQIDRVKMGVKRDGTITGIHVEIIADLGAYFQLLTPFIPSFTAFVAGGPYKIPRVRTDITGVFTNKFPTDATRGAGRPEATHLVELMVDQVAAEIGIAPVDIRRRNFIPAEDFPAEVAVGIVYDSGDYNGTLDKLLSKIDMDAFERERAELRARGIYRGIGFSTYVEICGLAPSRIVGPHGVGIQAGFWESAIVRVHPSGSVTVFTGTSPHGQGLDTSMAQIVADRLGTTPDVVEVIHGDTNTGPYGMGTYGSRSLSVGGESVARAAEQVQDKAKRIVAHLLEASPEDIEVAGDRFAVRGSPDKGMALAEVSAAAYIPENLPDGMEPGLEETTFYDPENFVYPFGAHACIVDVDAETGRVDVARYVAVDDCGPAINPMLVEGQMHGGLVQGIGQALMEQAVYDGNGQLVTGSYMDYPLPRAEAAPFFVTEHHPVPAKTNPLGTKGCGEAGCAGALVSVMNAIVDALSDYGIRHIDMPATPERVWRAIHEAKDNQAA